MKLPFFHAKMLALIRLNNYLWRTIILKNGQQSKKTMEDVMQFLLVAGILAFGIFRQFNKEKNKKSKKEIPCLLRNTNMNPNSKNL